MARPIGAHLYSCAIRLASLLSFLIHHELAVKRRPSEKKWCAHNLPAGRSRGACDGVTRERRKGQEAAQRTRALLGLRWAKLLVTQAQKLALLHQLLMRRWVKDSARGCQSETQPALQQIRRSQRRLHALEGGEAAIARCVQRTPTDSARQTCVGHPPPCARLSGSTLACCWGL